MATKKAPAKEKIAAIGVDVVVQRVIEGRSYREIASEFGVAVSTLHDWIEADPERSHACACARERSAQTWDEKAVEEIELATNQFELQKARELAVHYRWRAKAVNPRRYGDKVQTELTGANGGPIDQNLTISFVSPK